MICLNRLNHKAFYLNSDLIEMVEETPDTLITMTTGKKFVVEDSADEVLQKIITFRNQCFRDVHVKIKYQDKQASLENETKTCEEAAADEEDQNRKQNIR